MRDSEIAPASKADATAQETIVPNAVAAVEKQTATPIKTEASAFSDWVASRSNFVPDEAHRYPPPPPTPSFIDTMTKGFWNWVESRSTFVPNGVQKSSSESLKK